MLSLSVRGSCVTLSNHLLCSFFEFCEKDHPVHSSGDNASRLSDGTGVNGKQKMEKILSSDIPRNFRQHNHLKEYEALSQLSSVVPSQEGFVDANSEKELV